MELAFWVNVQNQEQEDPQHFRAVRKNDDDHRHQKVVYGHVRMTKTAGTEINAELALRAERVCGNKGYSLNAYQENQRKKVEYEKGGTGSAVDAEEFHPKFVLEMGFEDCDYVSLETNYGGFGPNFWLNLANQLHSLQRNISLELHIPCRDPIDHMLSQCNMRERTFSCLNGAHSHSDESLEAEFWKCVKHVWPDRFQKHLTNLPHGGVTKCFMSVPPQNYVDYMLDEQRGGLQRKYVGFTEPFYNGSTNRKRNKTEKCIWHDEALQHRLQTMLLTIPYYQYCDYCIGSPDDLFWDNRKE